MVQKLAVILLLLPMAVLLVTAQDIQPADDAEINPDANISWPPPVYVLRGDVEVRGSANLSGMTNYFIEFRPIIVTSADDDEDEDVEENELWFPVTLPNNVPVDGDVLGTWNTRTTEDGLYAIRLTVNSSGRPATYFVVSPLRIENEAPDFVVIGEATPTLIPTRAERPTLAPSPTPVDRTPQVTARVNANVRTGDNTSYPVVDNLLAGQTARVLGVSASGSGWYYIELPNGDRGFIAPSTVTASGDIASVPRINPPATPTPIPTNTPVPTGNLTGSPPSLTPATPTCNEQFQVLANITNAGTAATTTAATVVIQDVHVATGQVQATVLRAIPPLAPNENFVVGADLTISTFYNEEHRINVIIDSDNVVQETNESDNLLTTTYTLQRGDC